MESKLLHFEHQTAFYKGKVRDVYTINDKFLVMKASNRISAFDVILPKEIPYKGQVLNQIAFHFLSQTTDIIKNWTLASPFPNITIGHKCKPYKVEMVVRGYLAGHAAREYATGKRIICGVALPEGLKENDKLPHPIITPTTKADVGHDEDISRSEIIERGIVKRDEYENLENYTLLLYKRGVEMAAKQGLILVDTKYEFGKLNDEIILMDEIHTPDSSRYFILDGYNERQNKDEQQEQLSKEFVRQWLIANSFQGKEGQVVPEMSDEWVTQISERYIHLYEKITGKAFMKESETSDDEIMKNINSIVAKLN